MKVKLVKLVTQFLKVRDPPPPSAAPGGRHAHLALPGTPAGADQPPAEASFRAWTDIL